MLSLPGGIGSMGPAPVVLQAFVLVIASALFVLARRSMAENWLNRCCDDA